MKGAPKLRAQKIAEDGTEGDSLRERSGAIIVRQSVANQDAALWMIC